MDAEKLLSDVTGRVREALDSAESRAREIVSEAEERAQRLVADAEADAKRIRERAEEEAQQRLTQVREALVGLEGAISGGDPKEPKDEVNPQPATVPEPTPPVEPEPMPPAEPEPMPPDEPEPMPPEPEIEPPAPAQPDREAPEATNGYSGERSHDSTAARIVAMKMALDGSTREEIAAHLDEHYDIEASAALLDDVMARAKR